MYVAGTVDGDLRWEYRANRYFQAEREAQKIVQQGMYPVPDPSPPPSSFFHVYPYHSSFTNALSYQPENVRYYELPTSPTPIPPIRRYAIETSSNMTP
jgi:hypothetical protein